MTISPPWMLPRRFASRADITTPSETRPYDGGRAVWTGGTADGSVMPGTVASSACLIVPGTAVPRTDPTTSGSTGRAASRRRTRRPPARSRASSGPVRPARRRDPGDARPASADPAGAAAPAVRPRRRWRPRPAQPTGSGREAAPVPVPLRLPLLLLWLAYLVVVPVRGLEQASTRSSGSRTATGPDDQPGTTYLLVGSDSRAGLSKEERKELSTGNAERRPHRHDHAAAHRLRARTCCSPSRATPWSTSPGTTAARRSTRPTPTAGRRCSCRRSSRTPASGSTTTSRSGWAAWPASSTRSAASRCARRRT